MRKSLLSIFLVFCGVSLSAQDAEQPYLSVRETGETASSADLNRVIEKLTDVPSFTTMTYYSERRKKERILFEEAALLSIEPPLPDSGKAYAPRYEFELFLKDASFGDMKWAGEITCTDGVLSMKMTSITPIRFIGIEAAAEGALEIVLNIKKKTPDSRSSVSDWPAIRFASFQKNERNSRCGTD